MSKNLGTFPLAYTQVCELSARDNLPIVSHIRIDAADLDSMVVRGILNSVITHEMGHALGFVPNSYIPKQLAGGGTIDPYFTGVSARSEFGQHGAWYTGIPVPLENSLGGGPRDPHWRFSVFGDELMVAFVRGGDRSPLSTVSLGFFQDLGYTVDFSAADPYEVTPPSGGAAVLPIASLQNDVRTIATPKLVRPLIQP